jgi:hypothetical protein
MFPRDPGDKRPGPQAGESALLPLEEGPRPSCVSLLDRPDWDEQLNYTNGDEDAV